MKTMIKEQDSAYFYYAGYTSAERDLETARTKEEFNTAFSEIISEVVQEMEREAKDIAVLGENGLSSVFAKIFKFSRVLRVTREQNRNGHADLVFEAFRCRPTREVIGEAKIYRGYEWHQQGISQLLNYLTGREERSLLLVYVKNPGIQDLMNKLKDDLNELLPCSQIATCENHESIEWSFVTTHKHRSGKDVEVWHLGCNLHHPKNDGKATAEAKQEDEATP